MKKEGKTTRPFRYDLIEIPYNHAVEVTNRFKGLDLIDRVSEELWVEVCEILQEVVIKTIPKGKKRQKGKWLLGSSPSGSRDFEGGDGVGVFGNNLLNYR